MIRAQIAQQEESPDDFADGLRAWLVGEESVEAEAAGMLVAETVLLHRKSLIKE